MKEALKTAVPAAPTPAGRPSRQARADAEHQHELEQALAGKDLALQQALVREEVALILQPRGAGASEAEAAKKGRRANVKLDKQKPR